MSTLSVAAHVIYERLSPEEGVVLDLRTHELYVLNEVGSALFEGLRDQHSVEDILDRLAASIALPEEARDDAKAFVASMREAGFFEG